MALPDEIRWLPGGQRAAREACAELPQKNDLCGAFVGLAALRAHGVVVADQDEIAAAAGSVLPEVRVVSWPVTERGRADYRLALPRSTGPTGTSAAGVAHAVRALSGQSLAVVPACGDWTPQALRLLLRGAAGMSSVAVIANVDTGAFTAQDTSEDELRAALDTGELPALLSRWRMPHFVLLAGMIEGPGTDLVAVVDSYPSLGTNGLHLQPSVRLAAALRRERMSAGGLLLVVPDDEASAAQYLVTDAGLRGEHWDSA